MHPFDQDTTRGPVRPSGGPPRPEEKPYLLGVAGEHKGRLFPLDGLREVLIGRGPDVEILCQLDQGISRRHARVSIDGLGRAWVEDLGSLNGTLVNGHEVTRSTLLGRGDRIFVGDSNMLKIDWLTPDEVEQWQAATTDALTECLNRASFESRLQDLTTLALAGRRSLGLLLADIDRFKSINDDHGHLAGDYVLQQVGESLRATLRMSKGNLPAYRYGGEEFAILVPDATPEIVESLGERLRSEVEAMMLEYQETRLRVTVSIGVAVVQPDGNPNGLDAPTDPGRRATESPASTLGETLFRLADERLYRAKKEGRNRVCT